MKTREKIKTSAAISADAAEGYWRATVARDRKADGTFLLGVRTTGIYCRPSCPARRPLRSNVVFFHSSAEAEGQGLRACLRCKPNEVAPALLLVQRAASYLEKKSETAVRVEDLIKALGTTRATLERAVRQYSGIAPRDLADAFRLKKFKTLLRSGRKTAAALYETGYGSSSRVYERSNAMLGMTPGTYQKGGKGMKIGYSVVEAAIGKVLVAATERGISAVYIGESSAALIRELREEYPNAEIGVDSQPTKKWVSEIVRMAQGSAPSMELPLDLQATAFQRRVWQELQRIPRGKTRTYAQVAEAIGQPSAARAVARACATNPVSIVVPCHRVIRGSGALAGYRWGLERKAGLLEWERDARTESEG